MIVPSMTVSEVLTEMLRDFESIRLKSRIEGQLLYKEMVRKGLKQQAVSTSYKSSRRNDWNMVYLLAPVGIKTFFYVKAADKLGIAVYSLMFENTSKPDEKISLMKYYKHFFDRYNERMVLGFTEISKTIKYFFKKNSEFTLGSTEEIENGLSSCHFVYDEGMGISWKNESQRTYHLKTFVSNEMFTTTQQQLAHHLLQHEPDEFYHIVKLEHLRKVG